MSFRRRFSSVRPESTRSDSEEIKSVVGKQLDRIGQLTTYNYANAHTRGERDAVIEAVAFGLSFIEGCLTKDFPKEYWTNEITTHVHKKFKDNNLSFTMGELMAWYKIISSKSKTLLPLPRLILEFENDPEEEGGILSDEQEEGLLKAAEMELGNPSSEIRKKIKEDEEADVAAEFADIGKTTNLIKGKIVEFEDDGEGD